MSSTPVSERARWAFSAPAACLSLGFLCLIGCKGGEDYQPVTEEDAAHAEAHVDDHHHHHTAPHGGHLIELGDHEYTAEVVHEPDAGRLVIYIGDAHAESSVPVPLEQIEFAIEGGSTIVLTAEPQEGDPEGQSSRFVASGDAVTINDLEDLHGSLQIQIGEKSFTGTLEHDHDHDHDHAHE